MTYVEVITQPGPRVEVTTGNEYHVVVEAPTPLVIEVNGLFPSTFISQSIDGGILF